MKRKLIAILLFPLFFAGCIQDEPLGIEADILEVIVPDLPEAVQLGARTIRLSKNISRINIWVSDDFEAGALSPEFVLTRGATIYPPSGTTRDFSNEQEQTYIVTSEDGNWYREYIVVVRPKFVFTADPTGDGKTRTFRFENYQTFEGNFNFHEFYEISPTGNKDFVWASGNLGFALTNSVAPAESYPTFAVSNENGSAVQLVTRSTGSFGAMVGMPIASGNLFLGTFDMTRALAAPLQATRFGVPYAMGEPLELNFWYKFQGGYFEDEHGVEQRDFPSVYAVLFKPEIVDNDAVLLDGSNVLTADNIISVALLDPSQVIHSENIETAEFSFASIPFVPRRAIDAQRLANREYYITIVFASSHRGQYFEGAVGNTLIVNEVTLVSR